MANFYFKNIKQEIKIPKLHENTVCMDAVKFMKYLEDYLLFMSYNSKYCLKLEN